MIRTAMSIKRSTINAVLIVAGRTQPSPCFLDSRRLWDFKISFTDSSPRLHQTVNARCVHRGCRPQPSRANGGIPLISQQPIRVVPDGLAPVSVVALGWTATARVWREAQGLSAPQGTEVPQVKRQFSLLTRDKHSAAQLKLQTIFAGSECYLSIWMRTRRTTWAVLRRFP
jgi:hypothetical protein